MWQSPLTPLVLPMAGAAQPKNFIVKIRNYNTMEPTGQQDWYWLRWGAGGRALTSWFPWSTLTNPASTTTGWSLIWAPQDDPIEIHQSVF